MMVLVVDEARGLLAEVNDKANHFRMFRHALASANNRIGTEGGIFAVLIDTNSKISDLTPPISSDPSSRDFAGNELASFPPFVLTHTMDANWRAYCTELSDLTGYEAEEKEEKQVGGGTGHGNDEEINAEIRAYKAVGWS
ncbi:unnamed protein product [Phytophthora fragariaefolia]|uniref:Unnamed protein product n=1 Tax=Phytophthora fragariaefolia TaxID=1490495 RepID=A0A9W6XWH7_9STRA|nr:unnamed protein product [Phytophthora fragariaefolia]